jgi:hypothetical protein
MGVLIAYKVHPGCEARATLNVSEISFLTDASRLFDPTQDREIVISGIASVEINGADIALVRSNEKPKAIRSVSLRGDRSSTCVFYNVRAGGLFLSGPSRVMFIWNRTSPMLPLGVESSRVASMTLTSQPIKSGLTCTEVHLGESEEIGTVNAIFSDGGGDSISLLTSEDARVDFGLSYDSHIRATQIPILSTFRFTHVDPRGNNEESVLLGGSNPSAVNQIVFPSTSQTVKLDADLLVLRPRAGFYVKSISVEDRTFRFFGGTRILSTNHSGSDMSSEISSKR